MGKLVLDGQPCLKCSSSDAFAYYEEENNRVSGYCFSCKASIYDTSLPDEVEKPMLDEYRTIDWAIKNSSFLDLTHKKIPSEVAKDFGVRASVSQTTGEVEYIYYPLTKGGIVVGYKERHVPTKKFKIIGNGKDSEFFGQMRAGEGGKLIIVTEGEDDAMAATQMLKQRGKNYRVVSLPHGANANAVRKNIQWLEGFENIFLSLDQDTPGTEAAKEIATIITPGKCKIMHFSEKDASDMLVKDKGAEYFNAIYQAQSFRPDGIVGVPDIFDKIIKPVEWGLSWPWETLTNATFGYRRGELYGFGAGSGSGKCLAAGTMVRLADGSTKAVEHIIEGDLILNAKGLASKVVALGKGISKMYKIEQTDGTSYTVNDEHILTGYFKGNLRDIPVKNLLKYSTHMYGYNAIAKYPKRSVDIDPYILGIWLGDGHNDSPSITCGDEEVLQEWIKYGEFLGLTPTEYTGEVNCKRINLTGNSIGIKGKNLFYALLEKYNLPYNKHIPFEYLINDEFVRLNVLAGIIDTDGSLSKNSYEVTTKYPRLAETLSDLARSLGFRVKITSKFVNSKEYKRVCIFGEVIKIPCKVERKKAKNNSRATSRLTITEQGLGIYYGFTLEGNKRFCLANYTVTHNTEAFKEIINHVIYEHKLPAGIIFLEESPDKTAKVLAGKRLNKRFHVPGADWTMNELIEGAKDLIGKIYMFDHYGGKSWEHIKAQIKYMVVSLGIKDIFLDHLTALVAQENDEYKALNRIMEEMSSLTQELDCTIFYISHLRKANGTPHEEGGHVSADQFKGSGAIVFWSNFLFGIERNQVAEDPAERNTSLFRVLKDRNTGLGTGTTMTLWYDHVTGRWREKTEEDGSFEDVL